MSSIKTELREWLNKDLDLFFDEACEEGCCEEEHREQVKETIIQFFADKGVVQMCCWTEAEFLSQMVYEEAEKL